MNYFRSIVIRNSKRNLSRSIKETLKVFLSNVHCAFIIRRNFHCLVARKYSAFFGKDRNVRTNRNPVQPCSAWSYAPKQTFMTSKRHTKLFKRSLISASGHVLRDQANETLISVVASTMKLSSRRFA